MRILFQKQTGFAHVAAVVLVAVAVAVGATGYFVFKNNDKQADQNSSTTASTPASSESADDKGVKTAAKSHFALVYAKKYQEAYNSETCQEFRDLASYDQFLSLMNNTGYQLIDLSAVQYTSVDVRGNQAVITGAVGPLDPNSNLKVSLLKKDGSWCIYGYSIE